MRCFVRLEFLKKRRVVGEIENVSFLRQPWKLRLVRFGGAAAVTAAAIDDQKEAERLRKAEWYQSNCQQCKRY